MPDIIYDITMKTSIGKKVGTMEMRIENSKVDGFLKILDESEPFRGKITKSGKFIIEGQIKTLMNTMKYKASGHADDEKIELTLYGRGNFFKIQGIAQNIKSRKVLS